MQKYLAVIQTLIFLCLIYLVVFLANDGIRKGVEEGLNFHQTKLQISEMEAALKNSTGR